MIVRRCVTLSAPHISSLGGTMDAAMTGAITAAPLADGAEQQRWFDLVCETYDRLAGQLEWSGFTEALREGAGAASIAADTVDRFVQYLDANDPAPIDTIGRLREVGQDLPAYYQQLAADTTAETPAEGYDEASWYAFLQENGARWDGTDAAWDQFVPWFCYEAEQQGLASPATAFVEYAASQPDKVAVFAQYGIQIPAGETAEESPQDVSDFPDLREGDTGEWVDYLDAMLRSKGF